MTILHFPGLVCEGLPALRTVLESRGVLGIAFVLHFSAAPYYFIGSAPTGLSTGTLGLIICVLGVLLAGFAAARKE